MCLHPPSCSFYIYSYPLLLLLRVFKSLVPYSCHSHAGPNSFLSWFHLFFSTAEWMTYFLFKIFLYFKIFIYLAASAHRIFDLPCRVWDLQLPHKTLSCDRGDVVCWSGIKSGPPSLEVQSLSHWATREVPCLIFLAQLSVEDRLV